MEKIALTSRHADIQALFKDYNEALGLEDSGGRLQEIVDTAEALLAQAGRDNERVLELSYVIGMAQGEMAKLNFATVVAYAAGDSLIGQRARRQLDRLT